MSERIARATFDLENNIVSTSELTDFTEEIYKHDAEFQTKQLREEPWKKEYSLNA